MFLEFDGIVYVFFMIQNRKFCQDFDYIQRFFYWKFFGVVFKWGEIKNKLKNINKICELYEFWNIICYYFFLDVLIQLS